MTKEDYQNILQTISENISEGIYIVSSDGLGILYNKSMSVLEEMNPNDVIGKNLNEVQSNIPDVESTLINALKFKNKTINCNQTYINNYGKEITTINTTVPILNKDNKVIAAVEIARDVTDIKKMSDTIIDLQNENIKSKKTGKGIKTYTFQDLICHDDSFQNVLTRSKKAAQVNASVLIYGETGTGKELIAHSIHNESSRRNKPFIAQNCAALPESLLEGILFGTAKGSFTGAVDRAGIFEQANGGTLLLDEINSLPVDLQSKLLRVLQENYLRRVGGSKDIPVDVRIIATINEVPEDLISAGKLRQDLYYRLKIIDINLPPLRARKMDILPLAEYFISKYNSEFGKNVIGITENARKILINYDYPGNIRELEHMCMSIVSLSEDEMYIDEKNLNLSARSKSVNKSCQIHEVENQSLDTYLENIEKALITEAFEISNHSVTKTAAYLKIKRQTLQYKLKKYNI